MTSVGVLDKVMAILDAFEDGSTRLEPSVAATRVGISTPTAYRLMRAMAHHRLLDVDGRSYGLGSKLLELGSRAHRGVDVRAVALPHLRHLSTESAETVELQIRTGHRRVPIEMLVGSRTVRTAVELGVPLPVHVGASSRVLLAWLDEDQAMSLAQDSADEMPNHPWQPEEYLARLRQVRAQGWEFSRGERDPETSAVSAPVRDRNGYVVAALVVSSTLTRLSDDAHRTAVIELVRAAAAAISTDLGHHPDESQEATP